MSAFLSVEGTNLAWLAGLVVFSAFFSGSETALFSLGRDDLHAMMRRAARRGAIVRRLLARPDDLLVSVLFGNLLVNTLFFSIAAVMAGRQVDQRGGVAGAVVSLGALLVLILLGEIVPKAVAAASPGAISRIASIPLYTFHQIVGRPAAFAASPVLAVVQWIARQRGQTRVEAEELRMLVELAGTSGALSEQEAGMLDGVVALSGLRVREVMVPRVDVVFASADDSPEVVLRALKTKVRSRAPVYDGPSDNIIGFVETKDLVACANEPSGRATVLRPLVRPVVFVPESARVANVLEMVRNTNLEVAIVVDEYGGTAGLITLDDLADAVFGEVGDDGGPHEPEIETIRDGSYVLSGDHSVRDWADLFEVEPEEGQFDTLGGFVTYLLKRIPSVGDEATWYNVRFTVRGMRRRRVTRVELSLQDAGNGSTPDAGGAS